MVVKSDSKKPEKINDGKIKIICGFEINENYIWFIKKWTYNHLNIFFTMLFNFPFVQWKNPCYTFLKNGKINAIERF
jgi:hypothetical protein